MGVNITWVGSPRYPLSKTADSSLMIPSLFIVDRGKAKPVQVGGMVTSGNLSSYMPPRSKR